MSPLDHFRFPPQWTLQPDAQVDAQAVFANAVGDLLTLHHFAAVPDIEADIADAASLRGFYRKVAAAHQLALIEVDTATLGGLPAVRTLLKARLSPRGFAFIGSYTLPFADRSYVIRVQSQERGMTGAREAAVMMMAPRDFQVDEATGKMMGWEQDPYDPAHRGDFMRNQADDARHDAAFPDHPLSKVRGYLGELSTLLQVTGDLRALKPFRHRAAGGNVWSRLWR